MKLLPKILALSLAMVVTTSVAANQLANEKQLSLLITKQPLSVATETLHRITDRFYPAYRLDAGAISTDEERHDWKLGSSIRESHGPS